MFNNKTSKFPQFIGFDRLFDLLDSIEHDTNKFNYASSAYPPYNLIKESEDKYIIEMAVAGVSKESLDIVLQENTLQIKTKPISSDNDNAKYLYKGIAQRSFCRNFTLADSIKIKDIVLSDGMLKIYLKNEIPESRKPKTLEIRYNNPQMLVEGNNSEKVNKFT